MKIMIDTDTNAPGCVCQIIAVGPDSLDKKNRPIYEPVLIQSDWNYPGTAATFGWSTKSVQKCRECGYVGEPGWDCSDCGTPMPECEHGGTDGTVDCKKCRCTASDFISAAGDFLADNDGLTVSDPGYFNEN